MVILRYIIYRSEIVFKATPIVMHHKQTTDILLKTTRFSSITNQPTINRLKLPGSHASHGFVCDAETAFVNIVLRTEHIDLFNSLK